MILVSNSSPLVAFSAIGELGLLRRMVERLIIPTAVRHEVVEDGVGWSAAAAIQEAILSAEWVETQPVGDPARVEKLRTTLDAGEAEAIVLASELGHTLLIDESAGRKVALSLNVMVVGSLGILRHAKKLRLITEARPHVIAMRRAGIYFKLSLTNTFLKKEGENVLVN